jgi:hypothetical protein
MDDRLVDSPDAKQRDAKIVVRFRIDRFTLSAFS